jgi:KDO2-lipid IV(A) lauroyltransferase
VASDRGNRGTPSDPADRSDESAASRGDRAVNAVVHAMIRLTLALPYRWRVPLFGAFMGRVVAPLARYDNRVRDNLAHVLPDLPAPEVRRLMRAVPDNAGRAIIEIYSGRQFVDRIRPLTPQGPGVDRLLDAGRRGQPVILVTGHFGNYDAPRAWLIANGFRVGGLYNPMANAFFNAHYVDAMASIGTPLFARGRRGLAEMVRFLKSGGMVGMVVDQYMKHGPALPFFGQPAPTALSAADLALKYDALLVPIYGIRQPDGLSFAIRVEDPVPPSNPETMTRALNASLEALVRDHMDQWFWIHRRWKPERRRGDQRASAAATTGP